MPESFGIAASRSNLSGGKFVTRKNLREPRVTFRDLARIAFPRKAPFALQERTGKDLRTCKRWLSKNRKGRVPAAALGVVLGEIMRRLD